MQKMFSSKSGWLQPNLGARTCDRVISLILPVIRPRVAVKPLEWDLGSDPGWGLGLDPGLNPDPDSDLDLDLDSDLVYHQVQLLTLPPLFQLTQ